MKRSPEPNVSIFKWFRNFRAVLNEEKITHAPAQLSILLVVPSLLLVSTNAHSLVSGIYMYPSP